MKIKKYFKKWRNKKVEKIKNIMDNNLEIKNKKVGVGFGVFLKSGNKILLGKRHFDPEKADSELHGEGTWTLDIILKNIIL